MLLSMGRLQVRLRVERYVTPDRRPEWMTGVDALETLAGIAADSQRYEQAARLMGCAAAIRDRTGYGLCLSERDTDIAALSASIHPESFDHAWDEGRALRIDEAVGYARRGRGERKRPTIGWASLIPTELQVVDLVQEGRTNAEIGERLFVSTRTVQAHLTRIYAKLGVAGRTQLAIQAGNVRS